MKKSTKVYAGKIPFNARGDLLEYPEPHCTHEWRENVPFEAELTFDGIHRGRSAANAVYKNAAGASFTFFLTDFADLVRSGERLDVIRGTWVATKRGANYGIRRHTEQE